MPNLFKTSKGNKSIGQINEITLIKNAAFGRALKIALVYLIFGSVWILFSDSVFDFLFSDQNVFFYAGMVKGCIYVLVSAMLIFYLIYPLLHKMLTESAVVEKDNKELGEALLELKLQKEKIAESEKRFQEIASTYKALFEQTTIGVAIGHTGMNIGSNVNPVFIQITGRSYEELQNTKWEDLTHPNDLHQDYELLSKFKEGTMPTYEAEKRLIMPDGSGKWVKMTVSRLHVAGNEEIDHICVIEDISMRKSLELALAESEHTKTVLLNNLPGMAFQCSYDQSWIMTYVSDGCLALTGYPSSEMINNRSIRYDEMIVQEYRASVWDQWSQSLTGRKKFSCEYKIITVAGETKWVWQQGVGIYNKEKRKHTLEGIILDITLQKRQQDELKFREEHNSLTGLGNRKGLVKRLDHDRKENAREKRALVLVNIKNFNTINLAYGYATVEAVIKNLAETLDKLSSEMSIAYHLANDRFAFYICDYESRQQLSNFSELLICIINKCLKNYGLSCSVGIVELSKNGLCADDLVKAATIASEKAVAKADFCYSFFDKEMEISVRRYTAVKNTLMLSADDENSRNIYLDFQPIIDAKTNEIRAFEALARLTTLEYGVISPNEFIPIAEETQLIVPLGEKIIYHACQFLKKMEQAGYDTVSVSINVSIIQLMRDDFVSAMLEIIASLEVSASSLIVEVTESAFAENYNRINDTLNELSKYGIRVAIDDFGTGYSSLARERELNVDCLKIDKYFADNLNILDEHQAITADIISMAHRLGHCVVAEGVEYEKQRQYLINHDCDYIQGYLFSKPIHPDQALELLKKMSTDCTKRECEIMI